MGFGFVIVRVKIGVSFCCGVGFLLEVESVDFKFSFLCISRCEFMCLTCSFLLCCLSDLGGGGNIIFVWIVVGVSEAVQFFRGF